MSSLTRNQLLPLVDKRVASTEVRNAHTTVQRIYSPDEDDAFVQKHYTGDLAGLQARENYLLFHVAHANPVFDGRPVALGSRVASLHTFSKQTLEAVAQITVRWHGFDLDDWAKLLGTAAPSPWQQADFVLAITRAALKALQLMHLDGMVHGDIKADNLCLPWVGATGQPTVLVPDNLRLIDLGLTLSQGWQRDQLPNLGSFRLASRAIGCTPDRQVDAYTAAKSDRNLEPFLQLDWRYDLWSLGCLLHRWPGFTAAALMGQQRHTTALALLVEELLDQDRDWYRHGAKGELPRYLPPPDLLPHAAWIARIDGLIGPLDKPWPIDLPLPPAFAGAPPTVQPDVQFTLQPIAPPEQPPSAAPATPTPAQPPIPNTPRRRWLAAGLSGVALAGTGWWAMHRTPPPPPSPLPPQPPTTTDELFKLLTALAHQPSHQVRAAPGPTAYRVGQPIELTLTSPVSGHLAVLFADEGQAWPQPRSGFQSQVQAGQPHRFPQGIELLAQPPLGTMRWVAVVTPQPVDWADPASAGAALSTLLAQSAATLPGSVTIASVIERAK